MGQPPMPQTMLAALAGGHTHTLMPMRTLNIMHFNAMIFKLGLKLPDLQEDGAVKVLEDVPPDDIHPHDPAATNYGLANNCETQRSCKILQERGSPPVVPGAHPSPCVHSCGTGGQRVSVTRRMRCPGPLLPGGLSVRLPWPPHRAWSTRPHLPPTRKAQPLRPAHVNRRARLHTTRRYLPPTCALKGSGGCRQSARPWNRTVK